MMLKHLAGIDGRICVPQEASWGHRGPGIASWGLVPQLLVEEAENVRKQANSPSS